MQQNLSDRAVAGKPLKHADNWGIGRYSGMLPSRTEVVGRPLVFGNGGHSTAIVAFDSATQRVLTRTGSVYQLGTPNLAFAVTHHEVMRTLGFGA